MQRLFVLTLAASTLVLSALRAQFSDFAVTDDGRLFFASSLNTGTGDTRYKIYRFAGDGLSLFATGGGDDPFGPSVSQPLTSGDGSITGYMLNYPCSTGSCVIALIPHSFAQLQGVELTGPAFNHSLQISRNARFLVGSSAFFNTGVRLVELPSQRTRQSPVFGLASNAQSISNIGSLLLIYSRATDALFYLPLDGEPASIPGTAAAVSGILSPDGGRIAYERQNGASFEFVLTDPQGSSHRVLATSPLRDVFRPSFANDGTLLFLNAAGQPMLLAPADDPRILIDLDSSVTQAIISGNGQLAWLATARGQLLRVRTVDGVADEMIADTPISQTGSLFAFPGSVVRVYGASFNSDSRFMLGDTALPVSEKTANSIALQIPWEYDPANGSRTLTISGARSPFRQQVNFAPLREPTITFERSLTAPVAPQIAHQDFRGVVTKDDPALPGETIHIFTANMGPVDQPVATGERSPASPPARVTTPHSCYLIELNAQSVPVRSQGIAVPFAGLAGGLIGIYQIDVTIPADWTVPNPVLQCSVAASSQSRFLGDSARIDIAVPAATSPTR